MAIKDMNPCDYTNLDSVIARGKEEFTTHTFYVVKIQGAKNYSITLDENWAKRIGAEICFPK